MRDNLDVGWYEKMSLDPSLDDAGRETYRRLAEGLVAWRDCLACGSPLGEGPSSHDPLFKGSYCANPACDMFMVQLESGLAWKDYHQCRVDRAKHLLESNGFKVLNEG